MIIKVIKLINNNCLGLIWFINLFVVNWLIKDLIINSFIINLVNELEVLKVCLL